MSTSAPQPDAPAPQPRRITQGEIIARLLERGSSEHSSVTLGRNSKGDTTIEVIVRTDNEGEAQTVAEALAIARAAYDELREAYPFGSAPAEGGASS